jgi:hypothetical protein
VSFNLVCRRAAIVAVHTSLRPKFSRCF